MTEISKPLGAAKSCATLLVLFIPSTDRDERPIDQNKWATESLEFLGTTFGGATAFPKAKGVWRDDGRGGRLVHDEPIVIQCYTSEEAIEKNVKKLGAFLRKMGKSTKQGAVGLVIDRDYLEISIES